MAKNISLLGADYPDVPAVVLPKTGGGSAMFVDADDVNNVENALAIVVNGDTAPKAITSGQYLFIKNHSTLATGGYHATANISSGGSVSGSNVAADADGISNAINNKFTVSEGTFSKETGVTVISCYLYKTGNVVMLSGTLQKTMTLGSANLLGIVPSGFRPKQVTAKGIILNATTGKPIEYELSTSSGGFYVYPNSDNSQAAAQNISFMLTYIC